MSKGILSNSALSEQSPEQIGFNRVSGYVTIGGFLSTRGLIFNDAADTAGKIFRADGTKFVPTTATYPDTITSSYVLFATGTNTIGSASYFTCSTTGLVTITGSTTNDGISITGKVINTGITGSPGSGGSVISLYGGCGGSVAGAGTGGCGGTITIYAGTGGGGANAPSSYPGSGGTVYIYAGCGGCNNYSGGGSGCGGGALNLYGGMGGGSTSSSGSCCGGCGGNISLYGGCGGFISASSTASASGGAGGYLYLTGGPGCSAFSSVSGGVTGGCGGYVTIYGGSGGCAGNGSNNNTGGCGGYITLQAGVGGHGATSTGTSNTGACSGNISILGNTGGCGCGGSTVNTGGSGGTTTITSGCGGCGTNPPNRAITCYGGSAGALNLTSGYGGCGIGNASYAGSTACGGHGGAITITAGYGGNAQTAAVNNGGNGGSITLISGCAGTGSTANGTVGTITFINGATTVMTMSLGNTLISSTNKLQFRDTAIGLYSQADSYLDIFADGALRIGDSSAGAPTNYVSIPPSGLISFVGTAGVSLPYATLCQLADLTSGGTTSENLITFDTDTYKSQITHSTVSNPSRVQIDVAGTYLITFSAVVVASGVNKHINIWLKKSGSNVANSATTYELPLSGELLMTVTFIEKFTASQYFEIAWCSRDDAGMILDYTAGGASPTTPASPAVILTVNMISKD